MRRDPASLDREADPQQSLRVSVTNCPQSPGLLGLLIQKASTVALSRSRGALRTSVPLCAGGVIHVNLSWSFLLYFSGPVTWDCLLLLFISTISDGVISQESSFSLVACIVVPTMSTSWAEHCKTQLASYVLSVGQPMAHWSLRPPFLSLQEPFKEELLESHQSPLRNHDSPEPDPLSVTAGHTLMPYAYKSA